MLAGTSSVGWGLALAQDIFGRGARELIPLLDDVAEAFNSKLPVASQRTIDSLDRVEDAWQSLKRVVKVSLAEMISGVMDVAQIMPSALGPLGLMFSGTSLDKRKPPSFLQGKFQPWIPPTASHDAGMGMIPGVTMAELEQSEKDLAKARREEAQAAREAAAAAKELENSIQSWVRS